MRNAGNGPRVDVVEAMVAPNPIRAVAVSGGADAELSAVVRLTYRLTVTYGSYVNYDPFIIPSMKLSLYGITSLYCFALPAYTNLI